MRRGPGTVIEGKTRRPENELRWRDRTDSTPPATSSTPTPAAEGDPDRRGARLRPPLGPPQEPHLQPGAPLGRLPPGPAALVGWPPFPCVA